MKQITFADSEKMGLTEDEIILDRMRRNYRLAKEAYSETRQLAERDFQFYTGNQWNPQDLQSRRLENRPALVFNKLSQFVKIVVNNMKQNRPAINVKQKSSQADKDGIMATQAIINNIQADSIAEIAYDKAYENAAICGEGYLVLRTEYVDDDSFDLKIKIEAVDDIFSVYLDPKFKSDFSDINWGFITKEIPKDVYKALYPESSLDSFNFLNDGYEIDWLREDAVRIAEYYWIEEYKGEIYLLKNGQTVTDEEVKLLKEENEWDEELVVTKRQTIKRKVKWIKTNGCEILDKTDFPGSKIPIIPVLGDYIEVKGKRTMQGIVRQGIDSQVMLNFTNNNALEQMSLSPKAPYLVAAGSIGEFKHIWDTANIKSYPYLPYKPVAMENGQLAPPPQRAQYEPQIQSLLAAKATADEDLKSTVGLYDPSLGKDNAREVSGVALLAKQRQGELSTYSLVDNFNKSLKYLGSILLDIIPKVYDTEREIAIKEDVSKEEKFLKINSTDEGSVFLKKGAYDCDVTIGPFGETQNQEAIKAMTTFMQANPDMASYFGDILFSKLDWPGAKEISERLKLVLPGAILQQPGMLPPEMQAILEKQQQESQMVQQQLQSQVQSLINNLSELTSRNNELNNKLVNRQQEIESKERLEVIKVQRDLALEEMKQQGNMNKILNSEKLKFNSKVLQSRMDELYGDNQGVPQMQDELIVQGVNDPETQEGNLTEEQILDSITSKLYRR